MLWSMNNRESAKQKRQQKFCPKTLKTIKSTLRVPVARSGWWKVHCFSLVVGYITESKNLSINKSKTNEMLLFTNVLCKKKYRP